MKCFRVFFKKIFILFIFYILFAGPSCSSRPLQPLEKLNENQEFHQKANIQSLKKKKKEKLSPSTVAEKRKEKKKSTRFLYFKKKKKTAEEATATKTDAKTDVTTDAKTNAKTEKRVLKTKRKKKEKPLLFKSKPDPYTEGEKLTYNIGYYNIFNAGILTLEYPEKVDFNKRRSYYFRVHLKTTPVFSFFYSVNDKVEIWIDEKKHFAHAFALYVDESKQKRKTKGLFDFKNNLFSFWETKVNRKGKKETEMTWEALPLTQNVFSVLFYLRFLDFELGKEYSTPVADKGKNLIFKAKVLRKEELKTKIGILPAWVLEPKVELNGVFKPMGKVLIWISADENKYVLKITSKIKIGKIYVSLKSIEVPQPH